MFEFAVVTGLNCEEIYKPNLDIVNDDSRNKERLNPDYVPEKKTYNLHGCPFAVQVWVLEIFHEVCQTFALKSKRVQYPRILNWIITKHVSFNAFNSFIFDKKK
ncbi:hypothetical protein CUMW_253000, partial [Citrus unshiu]